MGEAVRPKRPGRAGQDVRPGGLAEQVPYGAGRLAGDPCKQAGSELRAHHGARGDDLDAPRAQPGQAPLDRLADPKRDSNRLARQRPVGGAGLGEQQAGHLLDEERVAAGPPPDRGDQCGLRLAAHDGGHQAGDLVFRERTHWNDGAPGGEIGQQRRQRVVGRLVEITVRPEQEHPGGRELAGHEIEQVDRGGIRPLKVVEDHGERPILRGRQQHRGKLVEEPETRRRGQLIHVHRWVGGPRQLGQEPRQRRGRRRLRGPALRHEGPEHLHPGPIRRRTFALPAPAPHDTDAAAFRLGGHLGGHRRLADAGLAGQQQQPAAAPCRVLDGAAELGEHVLPPDEPGPGRLPRPRPRAVRGLPHRHPRAILPPCDAGGPG